MEKTRLSSTENQEETTGNQAGPGRPKGLTRAAADKRRQDAYRLHLLGVTQTDIGQSLGITEGQVSRYVASVRNSRAWTGKPARERYEDLLQLIFDRSELVWSESWRVYHDRQMVPEEKRLRSALLHTISSSLGAMCKFIPDAEGLKREAQIDELRILQGRLDEKFNAKKVEPLGLPRFKNTP